MLNIHKSTVKTELLRYVLVEVLPVFGQNEFVCELTAMGAQKLEKIRLNKVFACGLEIRITNIHCLHAGLLLLQQRDERVAVLRLHFGKTIVH